MFIFALVLEFSNWKLPHILHTDASLTGLEEALYQEQKGELRVIGYASCGLSASERQYINWNFFLLNGPYQKKFRTVCTEQNLRLQLTIIP